MLISAWLTAVRNRFQSPRVMKRRPNQKFASRAAENLEQRALLTALQAVRPNIGEFLTPGEIRTVAPQELTLQFDLGDSIDASSISSSSIFVERTGFDGVFGNGNDVPVTIGYIGVGNSPNEVVLRFGETLPDENYRITINGTGTGPLTANGGGSVTDSTFDFELDLGAQIVAVDPQPVTRLGNGTLSQARNSIVLYFNEDDLDLASAENENFYQLIFTNETVSSLDDVPHIPTQAVYNNVANTVTLTFAGDISTLSGPGSYRLRVGNAEPLPLAPATMTPGEAGSSFAAATGLPTPSTLVNTGVVISSAINAQFMAFNLPGAGDEPGHREIEVENHLNGGADGGASGIPYISYNFKDNYGSDPSGNPLSNLITEPQKDRAREIFQFYSERAGIDFIETASSGLTIVTGDMRALDPTIPTGPGGVGGLAGGGIAIMDMAETWDSSPGGGWFSVAMHEIGHLLGQGHTYDLPALTIQGSGSSGSVGTNVEPVFPGDHDIVHIQHMSRPDSIDIDLYRFQVDASSLFTAEVMAERLANSSRLDSVLRLYREVGGQRELISQNDNYFSKDSFLELTLEPGVYFIGVSSTGNDAYDPTIANTGFGGTSQGAYDLRVNFRPNVTGLTSTIIDTTDRTFDGDSDGLQGGVYNFWFKTASVANTLFVDKSTVSFLSSPVTVAATSIIVRQVTPFAVNDIIKIDNEQMRITAINVATRTLTVTRAVNGTTAAVHSLGKPVRKMSANGQIGTPFGFIGDATAVATPGQIVRIVGNGGADNDIATINDNLPYEIGLNTSNQALADGASLEVPKGVAVMIDAGAVLKLRRGWIGAGSSTTSVDRSGNALQVLGIPDRQVIFTSWNDESIGTDTTSTPTSAAKGDWGGIIFRNEIDRAQNRFNPENEGIFVHYVSNADIRWGGGTVTIDTTVQTINPIHMDRSQPTIVHNLIQFSNDSALSADPDSFEELTFHSPRHQSGKPAFTVDYRRVGPEIHGNTLLGNGNNALFVRIDTLAGGATQSMTVPGRFDDVDTVHLISQNLILQGTPGGAYQDSIAPSVTLVTLNPLAGGTLPAGTYNYRIVFTDENGFESPASVPTGNLVLAATGSIRLAQLPPATGVYTGRRIYRSQSTGVGPYSLVAELDKSATTYTDTGVTLARTLTAFSTRDRARLDARLSIDPGIVVKITGARIEANFGSQLIAEGAPGRQVIFTSRLDDRYGAGGTFDTNSDDGAAVELTPGAGDWGGFYIGHLSSASIDRSLITFGGGSGPSGGGFSTFNPVEIHQAKVRIRNSAFETNADGTGGSSRSGLFPNAAGTIFVRGAQPVLLDNTFVGNSGAVVNINVNALNKEIVTDYGRSTGLADRELSFADNQGPLIRHNIFDSNTRNGMIVRGETLTTQVIWDDTNIVHILLDEIYVPNLHTYGGIRLESSSTESLVVKLAGANAGFTAGGSTMDITDRIGGMLHIIGQPGQPVILTSLSDDTVGAGFDLQGFLQKDTNGNGVSTGVVGGWRGVNIDQYSHDRNVAVYVENEIADRFSADTNPDADGAEVIGSLAEKPQWGDENLRLGVDLQGFIDNPADVDVFSFSGVAGSQVWIDIDRSTYALDTVVDLLDTDGNILAQSDNYYDEKLGSWQVVTQAGGSVQAFGSDYSQYLSDDHYTINPRDAGLRVILPGTVGVRGKYFVRVRSSNIDPTTGAPRTDLQDSAKVQNGLTNGVYQLQIRLQEEDEFAGTTIQFADIRFAQTGIRITGQPVHSPLTGESEEVEPNNAIGNGLPLGNMMDSDRAALAVRGTIGAVDDVDFYKFEVNYTHTQQITGVSLTAPQVPVVFDLDYADGIARANLTMAIYDSAGRLILVGRDSNITDDQAGPLEINGDLDDLNRGSVGTFDPFVGTVELPGGIYSLAVFNNRQVPQGLDQFFIPNSSSPLLRVEPINSVNRIFEERFTAGNNDLFTSANQPITNLFNVSGAGVIDPRHVVPYHLGDVVLFVSVNGGLKGSDETFIGSLNPFTGEIVTSLGSFGPSVGDIAMRPDGQLYTFSTGAGSGSPGTSDNAGNTGNYLRIDTGTAATTVAGDDGIDVNLDNTPIPVPPDDTVVGHANGGFRFNAMTYTGTGDKNLFAVGNRFDHSLPANTTTNYATGTNILYRFDIRTGAVDSNGASRVATGSQAATQGAGTTQREIGQINALGNVTGMTRAANGQTYIVDDIGNLYSLNLGNANASFIAPFGTSFTSLVAGPDEVEGGRYANTLFAMTASGQLMAFSTAGVMQPIFFDGQDTLDVGVFGTSGLAFSTLDRNLWATTTNRGDDLGHGVEPRFDDSILEDRQPGGRSLYFGNQRTGAAAGNQNNLNTAVTRNVDFPGGAQGTVISNEFSLKGYRNTDKPSLYFNYFLETEGAAWDPNTNATTLMRDAFRVFVADESGEWNLVSTNDSFHSSDDFDEFDYGPDGTTTAAPVSQTFPDVIDTFDNTGTWRQARIDLSNYAGRSNLRLRFDFSTAASMNLGNTLTTGSELRALDGSKMRDGDSFTIDGVVFEFDMGSSIVVPTGAAAVGQSFTVGGQTFTFATVAGGPNTIVVSLTDSPSVVAARVRATVNAVLGGGSAAVLPTVLSNRVTFPGRTVTAATGALSVDGAAGFTGDEVILITPDMTASQIAVLMRQGIANQFSAGDITNIKGSQELVWVIGHNVDNAGPLGFANELPGDVVGAFNASFQNGVTNRPGSLRGMNNAVEGVYIDDIILGFAERGEMVVNAPANTAFTPNNDIEDDYPTGNDYLGIDLGPYDVEIRRATDYAQTVDDPPTNALYKAIDTNDREAQLVSLTIPSASLMVDGATITLRDGINQVVFQFIDSRGTTAVTPGAFAIFFDPSAGPAGDRDAETSISLAAKLRNAINSVTVQNVLKIKASLSDSSDQGAVSTSSRLHLTRNAQVTVSANIQASVTIEVFDAYGDHNHYRDQGQLIIQSSFISDSSQFGIVADATVRSGAITSPHAGSVRNLHTINNERLVTGVVISNNVIVANALGGIQFSGDQGQASGPQGQVPYGRIINNTIVGTGVGTGILVEQTASPTILNNIIADFATGISVDGPSQGAGTTLGYNLYRGNTVNSNAGLGAFPMVLAVGDPLFVDQANRNYYPAPGSLAIDSSITSLGDRDSILDVKAPMDLDGADDSGSPIIGPEFDVYGQLRGNDPDVETPSGQGSSVFVDRGAIDRVDFIQPRAQLSNPEDQSLIDGDLDIDEVWIDQSQILRQFRIRLIDEGVGIDNRNINTTQFVLKRVLTDGTTEVVLVDGVDYQFVYNEITREAIFNAATFFADQNTEVRYIILVDNDGISGTDTVNGVRDLAGNYLLPNRSDNTTRFDIVLTDGVNDAPVNNVPLTAQTTPEDTTLIFRQSNNNLISIFDQDAHLGSNVLTVTLTATNGVLTLGSIPPGITFAPLAGDGTLDVTMTFTGKLQEINAALDGLRFIPDQDYFGPASLTITTDDLGEFSGPPASDTDVIAIDVTPVNDAPIFNPISSPAAVQEHLADLGITIAGFMTGQIAGPANETPPQTVSAVLTVQSVTGNWTTSTFFAAGPAINTTNGNLTFTTRPDVNGTATIRVVLVDSLGLQSAPQTFVLTVNAINDEPVYTRNPLPASNEDAGFQRVALINTFAAARATALDEVNIQTLTWVLSSATTTSGNLKFDLLRMRQSDGALEYTARANTAGTATVTLKLRDNGSGVAPNDNETTAITLTITVNQINDAPVAISGDYIVDEGYSITLDASASYDVDAFFGDTLTYAWDLDNNGTFETSTGTSPVQTFPWSTLTTLGITAPSVRTIQLQAKDQSNATDVDENSTLTTLIVDYGDAPNTYGTLKSSSGAAHTIANGLFLGAGVDKEMTGQPSPGATGDGSDENGVVFPTYIEASPTLALPAYVDVTASAPGKLDVWLDKLGTGFGVFNASEKLNAGVSYTLTAGLNRINFTIPAGTTTGDTFMRFRFSSAGLLSATGRANDGEVEDYAVKIRPLSTAVTPTINRPVDANPGDGIIPKTTDLTPTVAWSVHPENHKYNIEVRNSADVIVFSQTGTTLNSADITSTLPAGIYTVTVTAFNKIDVAAAAATYQFEVVPLVVASPSGDVGTSRPTINWNHVEGSKTYIVQIESVATGSTVLQQTIVVSSVVPPNIPNRLNVPSDLAIGKYRVRVRATDAVDLPGDWSPFVNFQVRTAPVVTAPTGSGTSLKPPIVWNAVAGAVSYEVELFNITDNVVVSTVTGITVTTWTPATNLILAEYRAGITAINAAGDRSFQGTRNFTVAPVPVAVTPSGRVPDATPSFGWNAVPGANKYELIVKQAFGAGTTVISQLNLTGTSFTQPTSLPVGRYTYQVRAVNTPSNGSVAGNAFSSQSVIYAFTITERPIVVNPPSTTFDSRPVITWTNPFGSDASAKSEVWLDKKEGSNSVNIVIATNITGTTYTPTQDLILGTYVVWVRTYSTVDPVTVSDWSIPKTFRVTTAPALIGPSGRTADATPTLTWQGVNGGQTYRVYVSSLSLNLVAYDIPGLNTLNYTIPSNLPIGRYRYWVQASSAFGDLSNWSIPKDFQIVSAPVLSGPSASTFDATPSFSWTNMAFPLKGVAAGAQFYDFRLDQVLPTSVVTNYRVANGLTTTNYTIPTDLPVGMYRAYIRARNADTQGDFSVALEFFVGGRPVVNVIGSTSDTTPTITWKTVDGASSYEIFISLASTPNTALVRQAGIGATSYTVPQPLAKGQYRVWVRAVNASNNALSLWSEGPSTNLTITDASDAQNGGYSSSYTLTAVSAAMPEMMSQATISMLPAVVSDSGFIPLAVAGEVAVTGEVAIVPEPVSVGTPSEVVKLLVSEETTIPQTDEVLAQWHEQSWWNEKAPVSPDSQPEKKEELAASVGFLGAIFAMAPRSLRRRRRDESST